MWYTILIMLVVDFGGLLIVYMLLRDRVRRATSVESRVSEIRDEVSRLLVELNQATDRNIALMEDKITVLNEAISTADKKIGLLRRETEKHDMGSQIYSRLAEGRHRRAESAGYRDAESAGYRAAEGGFGAAENPPGTSAGGFGDAKSAEYRDAKSAEYRDAKSAEYRAAGGGFGDANASPQAVELSAAESRGAETPDVRQRVMMLYRAGFSPSLIASRVGAPMGEVELIISLEQRKGQA